MASSSVNALEKSGGENIQDGKLYNLIVEVICSHFVNAIGHTEQSCNVEEDYTRYKYEEVGLLGDILSGCLPQ